MTKQTAHDVGPLPKILTDTCGARTGAADSFIIGGARSGEQVVSERRAHSVGEYRDRRES